MFRHTGRVLIALLVGMFAPSCDKPSDDPAKKAVPSAEKETQKTETLKAKKAPDEISSKPEGLKTNQASATFQGKTINDLGFQGGIKLSVGYMLTFVKGRIRVMMNVPSLKLGTYEADKPGKGVALTLTGAGEPGKVSVRAMRKAKMTITKDGETVEGTYDGVVAGPGEEGISLQGSFRFDRKRVKE